MASSHQKRRTLLMCVVLQGYCALEPEARSTVSQRQESSIDWAGRAMLPPGAHRVKGSL